MNPSDARQAAWNDYRRRRWQARAASLAGYGFLASIVILVGLGLLNQLNFSALGTAWVALIAITSVRMYLFLCPRCGSHFSPYRRFGDLFRSKCHSCGISVGEDPGSWRSRRRSRPGKTD